MKIEHAVFTLKTLSQRIFTEFQQISECIFSDLTRIVMGKMLLQKRSQVAEFQNHVFQSPIDFGTKVDTCLFALYIEQWHVTELCVQVQQGISL